MLPSLVGLWAVSYASGSDPDAGPHSFCDGKVQLWKNNWMVLRDHIDDVVKGRFLLPEESIKVGSRLIFLGHFARILKSQIYDLEVCPPSSTPLIVESTPDPKCQDGRWKISYSTNKDLDRERLKSYDGELHFLAAKNWLMLQNAKGEPIAVKLAKCKIYSMGSKVHFSHHVVRIGKCMQLPYVPPVGRLDCDNSGSLSEKEVIPDSEPANAKDKVSVENKVETSSAVYDSLSLGLDFSDGLSIAHEIKRLYSSSVHPKDKIHQFRMVVSFGRASFRLTEDLVGLALEAATGGFCGLLNVTVLQERVFAFSVANRHVAFFLLGKRSYQCKSFKCYFHLWSEGGPNWQREFKLWQTECDKEWTLINPSKRVSQMGVKALSKACPKSALKHTTASQKMIQFASTIQYDAHKGYGPSLPTPPSNLHTHWTKASPSIQFSTSLPIPLAHKNVGKSGDQELRLLTQCDSSRNVEMEVTRVPHISHIVDSQFSPESSVERTGLEEVVNDIAFRFWDCRKCLSMGHTIESCTSKIRCRDCFRYGHIAKNCLNRFSKSLQKWVPKSKPPDNLGHNLRSESTQPTVAVSTSTRTRDDSLPAQKQSSPAASIPT
jgi:hypothetical protein